jgi:GAF domain-containing protein
MPEAELPEAEHLGPDIPESGLPGRRLSELAEKAVVCTADCCGASTTVSEWSAQLPVSDRDAGRPAPAGSPAHHPAPDAGEERPAAVTHPDLAALVAVQLKSGKGPIPAAAERGEPVDMLDLLREKRWPLYRAVALDSGVRSSLTLPFRRNGLTVTLSLYSFRPGTLRAAEHGPAQALGELAATGLVRDRAYQSALAELDHMGAALRSRPLVDQACGIIMYVLSCDADVAFGVLRRISQGTNRKLTDVARRLVDTRGHGLEGELASLAPPAHGID